jgi:Uncharacterized conserved protein
MNDALGDRMKMYEMAEAGRHFMPLLPILARIDGRCFSGFTRGMARPFDPLMSAAMVGTTVALVEETNACMGYTQSDEITLAWHQTDLKSQLWFNGRISKMVSQLAVHATLAFYQRVVLAMPDFASRNPTFDARAWQVPNRTEAANVFVWREWDATKNSITMAASEIYSHRELHGKTGDERQEMLFQKGVNWNDYPSYFKRGTYVQRRMTSRPFTTDEIEALPPKHEARRNPDLVVERHQVRALDLPPFTTIANREAVIFDGAEPA